MMGFREKEIEVISKFYKLCYKNSFSSGIPIVIIGREIGAGYKIIRDKLLADQKIADIRISYSCNEYNLNSFSSLYQIVKIIFSLDNQKTGKVFEIVNKWVVAFEKSSKSIYQEKEMLDSITNYIISISQEKSILISIENMHFASPQLINMIKVLSDKLLSKVRKKHQLFRVYILGFYNLEDFLDASLKRLIFTNAEKGLSFKLKNYTNSDFKPLVARYFKSMDEKIIYQKIWNITKGSIVIFQELYNYLKKNKDLNIAHLNLIPGTKRLFYYKYLEQLNDKEKEILELLAFLNTPCERKYLNSCLECVDEETEKSFISLVKYKMIYHPNSDSDKFEITSLSLGNHILSEYDNKYKRDKYLYLQEKFEQYHINELEKYMMYLKNLSLKSGNRKKAKFYLFLLYKIQPGHLNSFRKVEILSQLIQMEDKLYPKIEYIITYCLTLIKIGKFKSASELLEQYAFLDTIAMQQKTVINLLLFNLYMSMNKLDKAAVLSENLKRIYSGKITQKFKIEYLTAFVGYYGKLGNSQKVLEICKEIESTANSSIDKVMLIRAKAWFHLGQFEKAKKVYLQLLTELESKKNDSSKFQILINLSKIAFDCGKFNICFDYLSKAKLIAKEQRDTGMLITVLANLSYLYLEKKENKKFLEHIYATFNLIEPETSPKQISEINSLLCKYYTENEMYDKAISCARTAKNNFLGKGDTLKRIKYTLVYVECLSFFNKKEDAQKYYHKLEEICLESKNKFYQNLVFLSKAKFWMKEREFDKVEQLLKKIKPEKENLRIQLDYLLLQFEYYLLYKKSKSEAKKKFFILKKFPKEYKEIITVKVASMRTEK